MRNRKLSAKLCATIDEQRFSISMLFPQWQRNYYFPSKKFPNENTQFSGRSFVPFSDFAHGAQTYACAYCRVVSGLYKTCLRCHCGWEARSGRFESPFRPQFLYIFRHPFTHFFKYQKHGFFDKIKGFLITGPFPQKLSVSRHNWNEKFVPE